ncbi:MAG: TRAP transporter large permease [Alphaproteobacteria bacterium]|nr:TRAP transporter large permease [Alphaproteobacteria bacterium]
MSSSMIVLIAVFVGLTLVRIPIGLSMLAGGVAYLLHKGVDPGLAAEQVMGAMLQADVLLAIPMFILCGNFISGGSIAPRLLDLARVLVGGIRGGLGHINVLVNVVFAAMSGSAVADAAGPGAVLIRMMRQAGYPAGFSAALTAAAGTLAPIIPPSIPMILYAVIANVSVGALFASGILPGLMVAAALMAGVAYQARRRGLPKSERVTLAEVPRLAWRGLLPLGLPVVILGGIRIGAFTPTEGAAVAALYALFLVFVVYREMPLSEIYQVFRVSLVQSASVMTIIMGAFLVNYAVAAEQLGQHIALWLTSMNFSAAGFLAALMVLFLILGCFIDTAIMLLVLVPMLLPTARILGVDLVHFGLVVTVNMMIGMMTPPYGVLLFVVSGVTGIPVREVIREAWYFCAILIACLVLLVIFPEISLYLPREMGLIR